MQPERSAQCAAEQQKVDIRQHSIIYELIDEIKLAMTGMLDPVLQRSDSGPCRSARDIQDSKVGTVAGCYVADGAIRSNSQIRVKRDREVVHTGKIEALKRFKNDVSEVKTGIECGISLVNYNAIQVGDIFEAFIMERVLPTLGS